MKKSKQPAGAPSYVQVRDQLREEIISGYFPAGTRITIAEITKRLGVSQMPVREAFQWLQGEGLIEFSPHKGASVLSLTPQYVENIYDIRGVLEGLLARLSLGNMTISSLQKLEEIHHEIMEAAKDEAMEDQIIVLDKSFHLMIYKHSGNPVAQDIYEKYAGLIQSLRKKYGYGPNRKANMISQHGDILKALQLQDAQLLEQRILHHSESAKLDLLKMMTSGERL